MNLGEIRRNTLSKTNEARKQKRRNYQTEIEMLKYELKKREAVNI